MAQRNKNTAEETSFFCSQNKTAILKNADSEANQKKNQNLILLDIPAAEYSYISLVKCRASFDTKWEGAKTNSPMSKLISHFFF